MELTNYENMKIYLSKEKYAYMSAYNKMTGKKELLIQTEDNRKVLIIEYNQRGRFNCMYITNVGENAMATLINSYVEAAFVAQQFEDISYCDNVNVFKLTR